MTSRFRRLIALLRRRTGRPSAHPEFAEPWPQDRLEEVAWIFETTLVDTVVIPPRARP